MHKKAIQKIGSKLVEIAEFVSPVGEGEFQGLLTHDGLMYQLPIDHQREFNGLVREFLKKQAWSEKFTEEYILKKLKEIFASILREDSIDIYEQILKFTQELNNYDTKMTVYLPVGGVIFNEDFDLGNIKLLRPSESNIAKVKQALTDVVSIVKNEKEKNQVIDMFTPIIDKEFTNYALSEFQVIAESSRAYERAKEETRRALEILRFASKFIYPRSEDVRIGLKGESIYGTRVSFVFSDKQVSTKSDQEGSIRSFEINPKTKKLMEKIGVFTLSEILKKVQQTNFENALLRSLHWFSSAIQQAEIENAFLCLIIALETIFKSEKGNPITNSVAEGVALLLSEDLEPRKRLKKTIKEYYGMRSGVSHGGKKVIMESDYYTLMNIVGSVIVLLTERVDKYSSQNLFMEWIEDLKMT